VGGAELALVLTTEIASVSRSPVRSSRTSLRTGRVIDGNGPAVSEGVTTHVALETGGVVVVGVVAVAGVVVLVGLVGVSAPHAADRIAPAALNMPSASRRLSFFSSASDTVTLHQPGPPTRPP